MIYRVIEHLHTMATYICNLYVSDVGVIEEVYG